MATTSSTSWSELNHRQHYRSFVPRHGSTKYKRPSSTSGYSSTYAKHSRVENETESHVRPHVSSLGYTVSDRNRRSESVDRELHKALSNSDQYFRHVYPADVSFSTEAEADRSRYIVLHGDGSLDVPHWQRASDVTVTTRRPRYTDVIQQQKRRAEMEARHQPRATSLGYEDKRQRETQHIREILTRKDDDEAYSGIDYRTLLDGIPKKYRPTGTEDYGAYTPHARTSRASSISRFETEIEDHFENFRSRRRSMSTSRVSHYRPLEVDGGRSHADISSYVIPDSESFVPTDVKFVTLPSGQKAVTYTQSNQYGTGDQSTANAEIEHLIHKTKFLQDSMNTLENFVRRNRHLFPEDTTVYQHLRFFQLSEDQLRQMGEPLDAVLYGVKIREKLVIPVGTDVSEALQRFYGNKHEVEIEYRDGHGRHANSSVDDDYSYRSSHETGHDHKYRTTTDEEEDIALSIRRQVEREFEERDKERLLKRQRVDLKTASDHVARRDKYSHMTQHLSPEYMRSIYVTSGLDVEPYHKRIPSYDLDLELRDNRQLAGHVISDGHRRQRLPQFLTPLKHKLVPAGGSARFSCAIIGEPMPQATWLHGTRLIGNGDRHTVLDKQGIISLEIRDIRSEDAGVYTIKIYNNEGETSTSATLEVEGASGRDEVHGAQVPQFLLEPTPMTVTEGDKAVFEVQVSARPAAEFQWFKDNLPLSDPRRFRLYSDEYGHCKLVIPHVKPSDTGLYQCLAQNKAGKSKSITALKVTDLPSLSKPSHVPAHEMSPVRDRPNYAISTKSPADLVDGTAPWFIQKLPDSVHVHEGEPLKLQCIIDGDPKPKVTWLKEPYRELQYSQRHRVVVSHDHHFMEIKSTVSTDAGRFIVMAENSVGKINATCYVNMLPARDIESDDYDIQRSFVKLPDYEYEIERELRDGKMAPKFIKKLPLENEISEGQTLEVECKVSEAHVASEISGINVTRTMVHEADIKTVHVYTGGHVEVSSLGSSADSSAAAVQSLEELAQQSGVLGEDVTMVIVTEPTELQENAAAKERDEQRLEVLSETRETSMAFSETESSWTEFSESSEAASDGESVDTEVEDILEVVQVKDTPSEGQAVASSQGQATDEGHITETQLHVVEGREESISNESQGHVDVTQNNLEVREEVTDEHNMLTVSAATEGDVQEMGLTNSQPDSVEVHIECKDESLQGQMEVMEQQLQRSLESKIETTGAAKEMIEGYIVVNQGLAEGHQTMSSHVTEEPGQDKEISVSKVTKVIRMTEVGEGGQETVKEVRKVITTIRENGEIKKVIESTEGDDEEFDVQEYLGQGDELVSVTKTTKTTRTTETSGEGGVSTHTEITTRVEEDGQIKEERTQITDGQKEAGEASEEESEASSDEESSEEEQSSESEQESRVREEKGDSVQYVTEVKVTEVIKETKVEVKETKDNKSEEESSESETSEDESSESD